VRALVIDDSLTTRKLLRRYLEKLHFEVVEAGDGREALARLRKGVRPDLMLVDWNMPKMGGIEFVQEVRKDHVFDSVPLIMVTTNKGFEQLYLALALGADEYVMKPFSIDDIREKLQSCGLVPA
jgi:two-component system chemotaxis response regulator CheY